MTKQFNYLLTVLLILFSVEPANAINDQLNFDKEHPLKMAIDIDYAPLEYVDEAGMPYGADVEYTKELMRRLGYAYVFKPNTWANVKDDVMDGRVDLGMMVYSPYRKNLLNYSRPVLRLYYQVVYRKQDRSYYDLHNLTGKEVACMSSYPVTDTLTKVGAVLKIVDDLPEALKELNNGRHDAVICFRYQTNYIVERYNLSNLEAYDLTLQPREYCYVSKNKELIEAINPVLEKMERDGTHQYVYGEINSQFEKFQLPVWVWYGFAIVLLLTMAVILVMQYLNTEKLKAEMEKAQRSERSKTIFLGNVSHALRTPLNAIIGFSDILKSDTQITDNERINLCELIHSNGLTLQHFINELLQLSDLESSQWKFNPKECNISELMVECEREIRPLLKPGVELTVEKTPITMVFDADLARIVVMHLLTNAVHNTTQGFIHLNYSLQDGGFYLQVSDSGSGLPDGLKDNILGLLYNRNTFQQNEMPGLGLSICQAIVNLCHGRMNFNSEPGKGTTFWLWVPKDYWKIGKKQQQ